MTGSFESAIAALRCTDARFPWVKPTEEEAEVADVLEATEQLHRRDADRCADCRTPWPCRPWQLADALCLEWLIRGVNRYSAHAREALDRTKRSSA